MGTLVRSQKYIILTPEEDQSVFNVAAFFDSQDSNAGPNNETYNKMTLGEGWKYNKKFKYIN